MLVLPVPLGKETKSWKHIGRLRALDKGCCLACFTLGFVVAVQATCRQINQSSHAQLLAFHVGWFSMEDKLWAGYRAKQSFCSHTLKKLPQILWA